MTRLFCLVSIQVKDWVRRQDAEIQANFEEIVALLESGDTWDYPSKAVTALEPLLMLLKLFDGDTPCLGKVLPYYMYNLDRFSVFQNPKKTENLNFFLFFRV